MEALPDHCYEIIEEEVSEKLSKPYAVIESDISTSFVRCTTFKFLQFV